MGSSAPKRTPEFSPNFIIPRKQLRLDQTQSSNISNGEYQPLSNIYEDHNTPMYKTVLEIHRVTQRPKEVPKTGGSRSTKKYKDTFPHLSDPTLPTELASQFQPLFCKLCDCQHSSNVMAKLHYNSKKHMKKVRKYLIEYAEQTGTPLHDIAKQENKLEDDDPKYFYCEPCDLPLTGRLHAQSHYSSKNHRRVILGVASPAGRGEYDNLGNWIRTSSAVPKTHDGFGSDFALPVELKTEREHRKNGLHCDMCNIYVTSEQQMVLHKSGTKHQKKVKLLEEANRADDTNPEDSILSSLSCTSISKTDLSVFRTPSGLYYCNPCNLSLNSVVQFKQHLESKKHKKKANSITDDVSPKID